MKSYKKFHLFKQDIFFFSLFVFAIFFLMFLNMDVHALSVDENTLFVTSNNSVEYVAEEELFGLSEILVTNNNITFYSNNGSIFYNETSNSQTNYLHNVVIKFNSTRTNELITKMQFVVKNNDNIEIGDYFTVNNTTSVILIKKNNVDNEEGYFYDSVIDVDGNSYDVINFGDGNVWFADHLKTTKDKNGNDLTTKYAYNGDYVDEYGLLYSASDIIEDDICPSGWHVSNQRDWEKLIEVAGGEEQVNDFFSDYNFSYGYAGYKEDDGTSNLFGNMVFFGISDLYNTENITTYSFGQYAGTGEPIIVDFFEYNDSKDYYYSARCVKDINTSTSNYTIHYSNEDYENGNVSINFRDNEKTIYLNQTAILFDTKIINETVYTNSTIQGYCNAIDPDYKIINYSYKWYKNDTVIPEQTNINLSSDNFNKGDNLTFECIIDNGEVVKSLNATTITVLNTAPDINTLNFNQTKYTAKQDIETNCSANDIDNDNLTYYYKWYINNIEKSDLFNLNKINNSYYNKNNNVTIQCIVSDNETNSTRQLSTIIDNINPEIYNVSISAVEDNSTNYYSNQTLKAICNASDYDSSDILEYTYKWYNNDVLIEEETDQFLNKDNFEKNDLIKVLCEVNDSDSFVTQNSSAITIINTPPTIINNTLLSADFYSNQTISMNCNAIDEDDDVLTYSYSWYKNDVLITEENSLSLSPDNFDKTDNITGLCNVSDLENYSLLNTSAQMILNTPPQFNENPFLSSVESGSESYFKSNNSLYLNCSANDYDDDVISYGYNWYKDGVPLAGINSNVLLKGNYSKNDRINGRCVINDGETIKILETSQVLIDNTEPQMNSAIISIQPDDDLEATCSGEDYDNDELSYTYLWYKNDQKFVAISNNVFDSDYYSNSDSIIVECQAYDGTNYSEKLNSTAKGAVFNFKSHNKYTDSSFTGYNINITKNNVEINSTTSATAETSLSVAEGGRYEIEMTHPNYITKTVTYDISSAITQTFNVTYNTSEVQIDFIYNNIKIREPLTNYSFNITNINTSTTTSYDVINDSSIELPLLANNLYNISIQKEGYLDYDNTFIYEHGTEKTENIYGSFYLVLNVFNEETLEPFDFSYPNSAKFIVNCGDSIYEYDINTSINTSDGINDTNILTYPITCEYEKIRFETKYLELDEVTGETIQILPYRKFLMENNDDFEDLNVTVYLIDFTETSFVYSTFGSEDIIGKYDDVEIYIKKLIENEDDKVVIQSDYADISNKMGAYLIENDEYIIEIHSSNYPVKTIGTYSADESEDKIINLNDINVEDNAEFDNIKISMKIENSDSGEKEAVLNYYDPKDETESVKFILHENTLSGPIFYETDTYYRTPYVTEIRQPLKDFENSTIFAEAIIVHDTQGSINVSKPLNEDWTIPIGINEYISQDFLNWFLLATLVIIGLYSTITNNWASLVLCGVATLFVIFGWLEISVGVLALAVVLSIFGVLNGALGGGG